MKILLEKWSSEDYEVFFLASNDKELFANMSDSFPRTLKECKQIVHFFSESTAKTEYIRAIKVGNQIVGCIGAFFETDMYRKNAKLSYWLSSQYRGKGIMSQAIKLFVNNLFYQFDIHRVWTRPFEHNKSSQKVLVKAGFTCEGRLIESVYKENKYMNSIIYALLKSK